MVSGTDKLKWVSFLKEIVGKNLISWKLEF